MILPSLNNVKEALSMAISWLENSKPFLVSCSSSFPASKPLLKFEALKVLAIFCLFIIYQKLTGP